MKNTMTPLLVVALTGVVGPAHAGQVTFQPGTSCISTSTTINLLYSVLGAANPNTSSNVVAICPVSLVGVMTNSDWPVNIAQAKKIKAEIAVQDNTSVTPFSCRAVVLGSTGWLQLSAQRYTCSVVGGCPDSTTAYTGAATLHFDLTTLGDNQNTAQLQFYCTIPKATSSSVRSSINGSKTLYEVPPW